MKTILTLTLLIGGLTCAWAQGTLQFSANLNGANEVPSNNSTFTGSGQFTLNGDFLDYTVGMSYSIFLPTSAGIYGPATESQTGNLIFDLGSYNQSVNPIQVFYTGQFTLSSQQVTQLESGLWYVNFLSSTYPDGEIRGQIMPAPEPSTLALLGLGSAA